MLSFTPLQILRVNSYQSAVLYHSVTSTSHLKPVRSISLNMVTSSPSATTSLQSHLKMRVMQHIISRSMTNSDIISSAKVHICGSLKERKMDLTFVTGNKKKLDEVVAILGDSLPFGLKSIDLDLPELQGEPEDVSASKCRIAAEQIGGPVIVEDTSLCFNSLNGLPGVYIKWFLEKIGNNGLYNMLEAFSDKSAYAQCVFAFSLGPGYEPVVFVGRTNGTIVLPTGAVNFGWDPIFKPDGFHQTYGEMPKEIKNSISHRYRALDKLRSYLIENEEKIYNDSLKIKRSPTQKQ
eukprot:gene8375-11331_t